MAGPAANYLAKYNGYTLPGYVQQESFDSTQMIASHEAPYADGSWSEYMGLQNKVLSLTMKVWEDDYASCKASVQQAAVMLRSKRAGFGKLYIQYSDRYYQAMVGSIRVEKTAGESVRTLEYQAEFECLPWLISDTVTLVSGNALGGNPQTITASRTLADGGWTPTTIKVSGTNVTISGYTTNGDFTGYVSISGAVANMVIDSEAFTVSGTAGNMTNYMKWVDFRTYVGPETSKFYVTGAQLCEIRYQNRWYI